MHTVLTAVKVKVNCPKAVKGSTKVNVKHGGSTKNSLHTVLKSVNRQKRNAAVKFV